MYIYRAYRIYRKLLFLSCSFDIETILMIILVIFILLFCH